MRDLFKQEVDEVVFYRDYSEMDKRGQSKWEPLVLGIVGFGVFGVTILLAVYFKIPLQ